MSEGIQSLGDEHAVVGEPASHPHQAVVVGEPPEAADPVLGEPAFANGLQDQKPILPSADDTSANGVQPASHSPPSIHLSTPAEENPDLQQVPSVESSESGIGDAETHQSEPPVSERSGARVDEASGASDAPVAAGNPAHRAEEESGEDFADAEITHIVESPSQPRRPFLSDEAPSENPFAALEEEEEDVETVSEENPAGDSALTDGTPTIVASSTPDEISTKGLGDQQEESAAQDKVTEVSRSIQADTEGSTLEGSITPSENVSSIETEQESQGDVVDIKEAKTEKEDHESLISPSLELDQGTERAATDTAPEPETTAEDAGNSISKKVAKDTEPEPETTAEDAGNSLSKGADQLETSNLELPTSNKDVVNENHVAPRNLDLSKEESVDQLPPVDSSVGTRDFAVKDGPVNLPPSAANGNNSYQHGEDGPIEKEQDLPEVDDSDHASTEEEKSGFRSKLPLIFSGIAIAAVGVVVVSFSRPR